MLGFRWMAFVAGAPDDARQAGARATLGDIAHRPLQLCPKSAAGVAPPERSLQEHVDRWLGQGTRRRAAVMVHGSPFSVSAPAGGATEDRDDPFNRVFAPPGRSLGPVQPESWLPLVGETDDFGSPIEDCAIGFGWDAECGSASDWAGLANAFQFACLEMAPLAARALATVLLALHGKGVPVEIISHGLGARVACQALRCLADDGFTTLVQKVLYLEGVEFTADAIDAARRLPETEIFNIGNQDDLLPPRTAVACHPFRFNNTPSQFIIARHGIGALPNVVDLQIDRPALRRWAARRGYMLDPSAGGEGPQRSEPHWAAYVHPGNRRLLTDIMTRPDRPASWFRDAAAPLGFARHGYGPTEGYVIPPMPTTTAARQAMLFEQ